MLTSCVLGLLSEAERGGNCSFATEGVIMLAQTVLSPIRGPVPRPPVCPLSAMLSPQRADGCCRNVAFPPVVHVDPFVFYCVPWVSLGDKNNKGNVLFML